MPCKRGILLWGTALDKRGYDRIRVSAYGVIQGQTACV